MMKIKLIPPGVFCFSASLFVLITLFTGANWPGSPYTLYAQDKKYLFKEYTDPDRMEGIVRREQLVSGEKLLLIAATIESSVPEQANNIHSYNLKFYVNDAARVSIEVWEYEKSYKMEPLQKFYPAGLAKFSWPTEIPLYYKIALRDLFPVAKTSNTSQTIYMPIALYYTNPERRGQFYSFALTPLKNIDSLQYAFYKLQSSQPLHSGRPKNIKKDQKIFIQWNGKDQDNKMAGSGLYALVIMTNYKPKPGTNPKPPITTQYQFYHNLDLLEQ